MTHFEPAYLKLLRSGELKERVKEAYRRLEACDICARECGVNRLLADVLGRVGYVERAGYGVDM